MQPLQHVFQKDFNSVQHVLLTEGQRLMHKGHLQGLQEGRQEGMQLGVQQGQRQLLQQMLESKFGPLSNRAMALLQAATSDQLSHWGNRLLTAKSFDELMLDS